MDLMDLNNFWPIIVMVVIFYFLLWRPQKKQQKKRQEMLDSMKNGAKIITAGGLYGTIVSMHDDYVIVRLADKVEVKMTRNAISQVLGKQAQADHKKTAKKSEAKTADTTAEPAKAEQTNETK